MRVFFSAGEASGDRYARELGLRLLNSVPISSQGDHLSFEGMGASGLASLGATVHVDSSHFGAIGILEALRVVPRALACYYKVKRKLGQGTPGLFVPIDFGYMNIKLARHAKNRGWKVLYFIPPGSWRRTKQGADLPHVTDAIITPFSWSAEILSSMGANAHWFGHPLKELVGHSDEPRGDGIAVLPGSRMHEIENNLPVIAEALKSWAGPIEFAVSPNVDPKTLEAMWTGPKATFTPNDTYGVLRRGKAAIVCSGTATLEAALCGCPMVVIYRGSKAMEIEYEIRKPKFTYVSMPNILLDRKVLTELIQWDATPERIWSELEPLTRDSDERRTMLDAYQELEQTLGGDQALTESARFIASM